MEDVALRFDLDTVRSPKSVPFPVEPIVIYSITFDGPGDPPPDIPLVDDEQHAFSNLVPVASPKSVALPAEAIVT